MATAVSLVSEAGYVQRIKARQHELAADEPAAAGGTDTGPAPYELLMAGLAACTSLTLRMYADRKGWQLGRIDVRLRFSRDEQGAETVTREVSFGHALAPEQRAKLAEIAEKTPVTKTLKRGLSIVTTLR